MHHRGLTPEHTRQARLPDQPAAGGRQVRASSRSRWQSRARTARWGAALLVPVTVLAACSSGADNSAPVTETVQVTVPPSDAGGGASTDAGATGTGSAAPGGATGGTGSPASGTGASSADPGASTAQSSKPAPTKPTAGKPSSGKPTDPSAGGMPPVDTSKDTELWDDNSMVPHLFFHSLVVDPKRAFSDQESGAGYLDYMVTQREFGKILQQLYDNNYLLVSPHQLATVQADGSIKSKPLKLPKGKKPLVLSVDDVSYYEYMEGDGFASKLVVADNGRVLNTYTDAAGTTKQGSYDVMPMVDDFIRKNPDFSHAGARGVVALTGYNGALGYRSSPSEYAGKNKNLKQDIATATKVADAMKKEGWEFASHSWGHINFTKSSVDRIRSDNEKWMSDVAPIVGKTDLLIYPFGADISGVAEYSGDKYDYLKGQGYSFYFNVDGSTTAWGQWGDGYLREARINVDGLSMKAELDGRKVLDAFFDTKSVLDPARPPSISGSGS